MPSSSLDPTQLARLESDLGLKTELAQVLLPVVLDNLKLLDRKQQDYGSTNLLKFGVDGVVVRLNDKLERIINLRKKAERLARGYGGSVKSGETAFQNEPMSDSFLDASNYALIAYVMSVNAWPKVEIKTSRDDWDERLLGHSRVQAAMQIIHEAGGSVTMPACAPAAVLPPKHVTFKKPAPISAFTKAELDEANKNSPLYPKHNDVDELLP